MKAVAALASITMLLAVGAAVAAPAPAKPGPSDWRTPDPENVLVLDTTQDIHVGDRLVNPL